MTVSPAAPEPRVRRRFIVALLLVLLLLAHSIWDYVETRRLRTRIDAIVARGEPVSLTAFRRPWSSVETADADRYYRAAATLAGPFRLSDSAQESYRLSVTMKDGNWTPEMVDHIRTRVGEYVDALAYVDRAASLPFEGFVAGWTFNYLQGSILALQRLCEMRAIERAFAGDADAALASLYSDVRLTRASHSPPPLQGLTVVMGRVKPTTAARERLAQALSEIDDDGGLEHELIRRRAAGIEDALRSLPGSAPLNSSVVRGAAAFLHPWHVQQAVREIDGFSALVQAARTPPAEREKAIMAVGRFLYDDGASPERRRAVLETWLKNKTAQMERVHCARRLVAGEVVDCHF